MAQSHRRSSRIERKCVGVVLPFDPDAGAEHWRHHVYHTLIPDTDGGWVRRWDRALRRRELHDLLPPIDEQWEAIRSIMCPALVMHGERSPITQELLKATAKAMPKGRYVEIAESRHNIHWGNPTAFVDVVRAFLVGDTAGT